MQLEQMYQEIILDHYRSPHGSGLREPFDAESFQINPTCGDEITLRVKVDGDTVTDVSYETLGCSISQASASVLTDLVVGRSVEDSMLVLRAFQEMAQGRGQVEPDEDVLGDGVAFAGVARYPARVKCALLGWMAFKDALGRSPMDALGRSPMDDAVRSPMDDAVRSPMSGAVPTEGGS